MMLSSVSPKVVTQEPAPAQDPFEVRVRTDAKAIARGNTVASTAPEASAGNHFSETSSTNIIVLFCLISSLFFLKVSIVQYRKYRMRRYQKKISMLERLWRMSPQKQP